MCDPNERKTLNARYTECTKFLGRVCEVVSAREEALERLSSFHSSAHDVIVTLERLEDNVTNNPISTEELMRWQSDSHRLAKLMKDCASNGSGLDPILQQAQLTTLDSATTRKRTTVRGYVNRLQARCEKLQASISMKREHFDEVDSIWHGFLDRKEKLLKALEDLEERAEIDIAMETLNNESIQEFIKVYNKLQEELELKKYELSGLQSKGKQLGETDPTQNNVVKEHVKLVEMTWDDTKNLISEREEQLKKLAGLLRDYNHVRVTVERTLANAESLSSASEAPRHFSAEEVKRHVNKLESLKHELDEKQPVMDDLTRKGKLVAAEAKRQLVSEAASIHTHLEELVDRYLDVGDKVEETIESLKGQLNLWKELMTADEDLDDWMNTSINELNASVSSLEDSARLQGRIREVHDEIEKNKSMFEELQRKMNEVSTTRRRSSVGEMDELTQVNESMKVKLERATSVYKQAQTKLEDFTTQKKMLVDYVDELHSWLEHKEQTLNGMLRNPKPEHLKKCRDTNAEVLAQRDNVESTKEHLNSLCRKFQTPELDAVQEKVAQLSTKYEDISKLLAKVMDSLEGNMDDDFNNSVKDFYSWFRSAKEVLGACADNSGDVPALEEKLEKLQNLVGKMEEGENRVNRVMTSGDVCCDAQLSRASADSVQQQMQGIKDEWHVFLANVQEQRANLETSLAVLRSLEDNRKELARSLKVIERSLQEEDEPKDGIDDKTKQLEVVQGLSKELSGKSKQVENLMQQAHEVMESELSQSGSARKAQQLISMYHGLCRKAKERLRACERSVADQRQYDEAMTSSKSWLQSATSKLQGCVEASQEASDQIELEARLQEVQSLQSSQQEGEVKLNIALGKGERASQSSSIDGKHEIHDALQELKTNYDELSDKLQDCRNKLAQRLSDWLQYTQSRDELVSWLDENDAVFAGRPALAADVKDKEAQLEKYKLIEEDVTSHEETIEALRNKAKRLNRDDDFQSIEERFGRVRENAVERVGQLTRCLDEHESYYDATRDFTDWINSAKEELDRWSDIGGSTDKDAIQRKLQKVQSLKLTRTYGRQKLDTAIEIGDHVISETAESGRDVIKTEIEGLKEEWRSWDRNLIETEISLESLLSQVTKYEESFEIERSALDDALQRFRTRLDELDVTELLEKGAPGGESEAQQPSNTTATLKKCKVVIQSLNDLQESVDTLKARLNTMCRTYQGPEINQLSKDVTSVLQRYDGYRMRAEKCRVNSERLLNDSFQGSVRDFDIWVKSKRDSLHKYGEISGDREVAQERLQHLQALLSGVEAGQTKLNAIVNTSECLLAVLSPETSSNFKQQAKQCRENWKNFLNLLQEREQGVRSHVEQLKEFDSNVREMTDWLKEIETRFEAESGLKATVGLKKSQYNAFQSLAGDIADHQYKYDRMKRKAQKLGSSLELSRLNQLITRYHAITKQVQDALKRCEQHVTDHQSHQSALTECQEWLSDFGHRMESYSNLTGGKLMLEQRLGKIEELLASRQDGEIKINVMLGRGEKILETTAPKGRHNIESQMKSLQETWEKYVTQAEQWRSKLVNCIALWEEYDEAVKSAQSWLEQAEEAIKNEKDARAEQANASESTFSDLEKCQSLYRDVKQRSALIEKAQECASRVAEATGDAGGTRVDTAELRDMYQDTLNAAQELLDEVEIAAESTKSYHQALHVFTDWFSGKPVELFRLSDLTGGRQILAHNLTALQNIEREIPEGEEKLKLAFSAGKKNSSDKTVKIQLQNLKEEWTDYRKTLTEALSQTRKLLEETEKYEKICASFQDWINAMEQCPDNDVRLTGDLEDNKVAADRFRLYTDEVTNNRHKLEKLTKAAQSLLETCAPSDGSMSKQVAQLSARYQSLLMKCKTRLRVYQSAVEVQSDYQQLSDTFDQWLTSATDRFAVYVTQDSSHPDNTEDRCDKLDDLLIEFESKKTSLSQISDKSSKLIQAIEAEFQPQITRQTSQQHDDFQDLYVRIQAAQRTMRRTLHLQKDFNNALEALKSWLGDVLAKVETKPDLKYELFEKKAQLARYVGYQEDISKHQDSVHDVINKSGRLPAQSRDSRDVEQVGEKYHRVAHLCQQRIEDLRSKVKSHQEYHDAVQSAERWLLNKSSQIMMASSQDIADSTTDSSPASLMEDQLLEYTGVQEEITNFRSEVQAASTLGKRLLNEYEEEKREPLESQIQSQLAGLQATYDAVQNAAAQLLRRLTEVVHKHQDLSVKLDQLAVWLDEQQASIRVACASPAANLYDAGRRVKDIALLIEDVKGKELFLEESSSRDPDLSLPLEKKFGAFKQELEFLLEGAAQAEVEWRSTLNMQNEFKEWLLDTERLLHRLEDAPAEASPLAAKDHAQKCKKVYDDVSDRKGVLALLDDKYCHLLGKGENDDSEFHDLISQWERLYAMASNLNQSQQRNLNATQDFNFYLSEVEALTQRFQSEAEKLMRNVSDSTTDRLEKAKDLVEEMQRNRRSLDALTERLDNLTPRMSTHDAEMVEDKVRHLNQRWIEAEQKLQSRAQLLESTACELREYRRQLDATTCWLKALLDKVNDPVPMTLSVEDLNAARQKHSMLCKELNQKKEEFSELSSCHQTLPLSLSATEREKLHSDVTDIQALFRRAQSTANDKTNALNHAIGRRKDLWATSQQALAWLEHIKETLEKYKTFPLHPDAVAKLIQEHRALYKEIVRHKVTVDEVIATGIQIIYEGKPDSVSVRGKLSGLEDSYVEVDELWRIKLDELQRLLADRELFHADVDHCLRWLKEADIVTFPEVNLAASLPDLETHLGRYEAILSESVKYRDLVSKVCEKAQEILPQLSDVDQSLLTDKMKNIKDQFEHVCKFAEDKSDQMRDMMSSRREYIHSLEQLEDYLGVGQTMLRELDDMSTGHTAGQARTLLLKAEKIQHSISDRKPSLEKIEKMRDCLKSSGQPWQPEELLKATAIYHRMSQQSSQRIERFREMALCRERFEHRMTELGEQIEDCDRELNTGSPSRVEHKLTISQQMAAMLTSCQIELRSVSGLAEQLCSDMEEQDKALIRDKVDALRVALHRIQGNLGERQRDLEKRIVSRRDFQGDLEKGVAWLDETQSALECESPLKLDPQSVQEEIKKLQITKEEVESRLRVLVALGDKEVQRHLEEDDQLPGVVSHQLDTLNKLQGSLTRVIDVKQERLLEALESRQRYADCMSRVTSKLGSASAELQLLEADSNPEHARDLLEQHQALFTTEGEILHYVDELEEVANDLDRMSGTIGLTKTARDTLSTAVGGVRERAENLLDAAKDIHNSLQAAAISWEGFDLELDRVTSKMTRSEEKLKRVDCSMPTSLEEAQERIKDFQSLCCEISNIESSVQALQEVSHALTTTDSVSGRMAVGRSLTGVKQRLTRLQAGSKDMQRLLDKSVREWRIFKEVTSSTGSTLDRVQDKLPNRALEKCTLQELTQQRSTLHALQNDVASVTRRLSTVHDAAHTLTGRLDSPVKGSVLDKAENIEDRCHKLSEATIVRLADVKAEMQSRETLNAELRDMLVWVEDMRENADRTLDIAPAPGHVQDKLDALRQLKDQLSNKEAHFNKISEDQRQKYLQNYAILPVELSSTIAKIRIALAALHQELRNKEDELESARNLREDYHDELMQISSLLTDTEMQLTDDPKDQVSSKDTRRQLSDRLDRCHVRLVSLDAVAQEIAEQTSHEGSKASLNAAVSAVNDHYVRVQGMMDAKIHQANQASVYLDELDEMGEFLDEWKGKAQSAIAGPLTVSDARDARKQMREHKNLRDQLRRLGSELERKRDRLPATLPATSMALFNRKIDRMLEECKGVESQIRSKEDELGEAVAMATDMEDEVQKIMEGVEKLREKSDTESPERTILQQIEAKKQLLNRLDQWKHKLDEVKQNHPYQLSPCPSPRKRGDQEPQGVPKLPLHTLREPIEAVRLANDAEQAIDEVELAVIADLLQLEAVARDNDVYEDEIQRLLTDLEDAKRRLDDFPTPRKGSSRVSTPRDVREELEEYRMLTQEIEDYQNQIRELRDQADRMKSRDNSTILPDNLDSPPYDSTDQDKFDYTVTDYSKVSPNWSPRTSTRQRDSPIGTPRDQLTDQSISPVSEPKPTPTFDDMLLATTKRVPISPIVNKSKSPLVKRRLTDLLSQQLGDEPDGGSPDSKMFDTMSDVSTCSTGSLLSPRHAMPIVSTSPDSAIAQSTDMDRYDTIDDDVTPRPIRTSSPFMVTRGRDSSFLDSPDHKLQVVDRSLSKLKEQLGEKADSLLSALHRQDDLQRDIQEVTSKLDDFQERLDSSDKLVDLQKTLTDTQELLDDINRLIPKLESVDRKVRFLDPTHSGKDAFQATVSVLYDRWDTIRMQATSKQNTVEIKILEDEQYRRMVEAYKAELQQVADWMQEAKKSSVSPTPPHSPPPAPPGSSSGGSTSGGSNMTSVHRQLDQCRSTVLDIERKLILLSELSDKSSVLSQAEEQRDALLRELESVKGDLENLQRETQDRERSLQNELNTKLDESLLEQESRAQKMKDWLQSLETDVPDSEVLTPTSLQRQLSEDLRGHQDDLESVARRGRSRSASKDSSMLSPRPTADEPSSWEKLRADVETKAAATDQLTSKEMSSKTHLTLAQAVDCGERVNPAKLKDTLDEMNNKWRNLNHSTQNASRIDERSQESLKSLTKLLDQVEFDLILNDWTKESDPGVQRECKALQESLSDLQTTCKQFSSENPLTRNQRDIQSTLRCLDNRMRAVLEQQRNWETRSREKMNQWRNVQVDLKMSLSQLGQVRKQLKHVTSGRDGVEAADLKLRCDKVKALQQEVKTLKEQFKVNLQTAEKFAVGSYPCHTADTHLLKSMISDVTKELQASLTELRLKMNEDQNFQQMLTDYRALLEAGNDKVSRNKTDVLSLNDFKQFIASLKDFSSAVQIHRAVCVETCDKMFDDSQAAQRHLLDELTDEHLTLQGRLVDKIADFERCVKEWEEFESEVVHLSDDLETVESLVPEDKGSSDHELEEVTSRIHLLESLQEKLGNSESGLDQTKLHWANIAEQVTCTGSDNRCSELTNQWKRLSSKVKKELERLNKIRQVLPRYSETVSTLQEWLGSSSRQISSLLERLSDPSIDKSLYDTCSEEFASLLSDLPIHRLAFDKVGKMSEVFSEAKQDNNDPLEVAAAWETVTSGVASVRESLTEVETKVSSPSDIILEMTSWVATANSAIDRENVKSFDAVSSEDCKQQITAYQSFEEIMATKQKSLDNLNSADTTCGADLEKLNRQWELLRTRVERCINQSKRETQKWRDHENDVNMLRHWAEQSLKTLDEDSASPRMGSRAFVTSTISQVIAMEEELKSKRDEIEKLQSDYLDLVSDKNVGHKSWSVGSTSDNSGVSDLERTFSMLEQAISKRKEQLNNFDQLWKKYSNAEQFVSDHLAAAERALTTDQFTHGKSPDKIRKLQDALDALESQRLQVQLLAVEADCVVASCHEEVGDQVRVKVTDINARWNDISSSIVARIEHHREVIDLKREYDEKVLETDSRVDSLRSRVAKVVGGDSVIESPRDLLIKAEGLEETCEKLRVALTSLEGICSRAEQAKQTQLAASMAVSNARISAKVVRIIRTARVAVESMRELSTISDELNDKIGYMDAWMSEAQNTGKVEDAATDRRSVETNLEELRAQLQAFKAYSHTMDDVNRLAHKLPMTDQHVSKIQALNDRWKESIKSTCKKFGVHLTTLLPHLEFKDKCERWILFVTQAERGLVADLPCSYRGLLEQARSYDLFIVESGARQQLLRHIIDEGEQMLKENIVDDRVEFRNKLSSLDKQWSRVLSSARERKSVVDAAIATWLDYKQHSDLVTSSTRLCDVEMTKFDRELPVVGLAPTTLAEIMELESSTDAGICSAMLDSGHRVMSLVRGDFHARLKKEISTCHNDFLNANHAVKDKRRQLQNIVNKWEVCDAKINDVITWLRQTRAMLGAALPVTLEDLHAEAIKCRDREITFERNPDKMRTIEKLSNNLPDLVSRADMSLMRERISLARALWHDVRNEVEQRKRSVEERINSWNEFGEKYRDLCEWLSDTERKVAQLSDSDAEDFLEKLQKDYLAGDSLDDKRSHLEKLASLLAPPTGGDNEVERKLRKITDRWQYLEGLARARARKLKETIAAVAQLDTCMTGLRDWLKSIEFNVLKPVMHDECTDDDIEKRLEEQKSLQKDIEKHSTGVTSVLNLCEVLLHDGDACATEAERQSIEEATKSLDRRWRNICALSMERRLKIEDTQRLWQKFLSDFARFGEWLHECEMTSSCPDSAFLEYQAAREMLRMNETFQRKVHEGLGQLELINKQYRRLARENRTDTSNKLKQLVHDGNMRWDAISRRVTCVLRRLKHAIERRECFEAQRESLLVWLTETDLQLTNLEHFSPKSDPKVKVDQVKLFQAKIEERIPLLQDLDARGKTLLEKSADADCVCIEEELRDFHEYCQEVVGRLDRYHRKLLRLMSGDKGGYQTSLFDESDINNLSWWTATYLTDVTNSESDVTGSDLLATPNGGSSVPEKRRGGKSTGRTSPHSVGSLEWDHYDISASEMEAKLANGEMTDDDSLPELTPFDDDYGDILSDGGISLESGSRKTSPRDQKPELTKLGKESRSLIIDNETETGPAKRPRRDAEILDQKENQQKDQQKDQKDQQQRSQMNHDLDATLAWLEITKSTLTKSESLSEQTVTEIERSVKQLKVLQKEIESRKPIVMSINIMASDLSNRDVTDDDVTTKLQQMKEGWKEVNSGATKRKEDLQKSFIRSEEVQHSITELRRWIDEQDRKRQDLAELCNNRDSPVPIPLQTLRRGRKALIQVRVETLEERVKVASLQEISNQLLFDDVRSRTSTSPLGGATATSDRLNEVGGHLKALLERVADDLKLAERALKEERGRMREGASSCSETDSVASDASLYSSPSLKLKMLRRKDEDFDSRSASYEEMTRSPPNDITSASSISVNQSQDASTTTLTNHRTVASTTTTSTTATYSSANHASILARAQQEAIMTKQTRTIETGGNKQHSTDSDGESGYVEYEAEYDALCDAVHWAVDQAGTGNSQPPLEPSGSDSDLASLPVEKAGYFRRALKAALPFYAFALLLFLIVVLMPRVCLDERFACLSQNSLHGYLTPVLTWTDGPPPT